MKNALRAGVALISLSVASPALAATFVDVGDNAYYEFDGTQVGTSASLLLTLMGKDSLTNQFTFSYVLSNTSDPLLHPSVRVRSFAFDDINVDTMTGTASTLDANGFDSISFNSNFPNGIGDMEFCLFQAPGSCIGGGDGAVVGDPSTGSFTLDYAGDGMTQLTLDNFVVRYQSTGPRGAGSGTGTGTEIPTPQGAVPEPSTWAMMLLGFGAIGFGMRRRKRTDQSQRVRLAYS